MDTLRSGMPEITRRDFLKTAGASLAFLGLSKVLTPPVAKALEEYAGKTSAIKGKPNIIWIVMDTVRVDHLSCYGHQRNTTPNIDRIASEGVLFEKAFATAPWTLPSHASMVTGVFPAKHGTDTEHGVLDTRFPTIAKVLQNRGYQTFAYTNNLCAGRVLERGSDAVERVNRGINAKPGPELTDFLKTSEIKQYTEDLLRMDDGAYKTNKIVRRWVADASQAETPFFLFINYMEAHRPYNRIPAPYAALYLDRNVDLQQVQDLVHPRTRKTTLHHLSGKVVCSDEDFRILRDLYDGEMSYLDLRMGQLFDYLRELNVLDNTVLIITSDHGENFGEHGMMGHCMCLYDTLLHVPLIIRYPALLGAGSRVDEQVQLTDIFPTILDIVGIEWEGRKRLQGHSLLNGRRESDSRFLIAEEGTWHNMVHRMANMNPEMDPSTYARRLKTVRTSQFKYIWASDGRDELYDILQDPEELNNLIGTQPNKAKELKTLLVEWLNSFETYWPDTAEQVAR